jgi:hypothetical protein
MQLSLVLLAAGLALVVASAAGFPSPEFANANIAPALNTTEIKKGGGDDDEYPDLKYINPE